jgi:16S rRNA (cytidine1402-2'-O)-methyltransferase
MSGTLFVVATPIGNLEDITLRALRVLREADVIAAEDTRRTARLLAHYTISTPMLSFHEHNSRARIPQLLSRLDAGKSVALVTDAGTPGISDPGIELVQACVEHGVTVDPVPGASAPLTAAIASGFPLEPLTVFGFPPSRAKARDEWFREAAQVRHTFTFFEAPHRIVETLVAAASVLGNRPIMIGRELTKMHQELVRADRVRDVIGRMPTVKGEFTVVVGPAPATESPDSGVSDDQIALEVGRITQNGSGRRRQVLGEVARKYGRTTRDVYAIVERAKKSGS